MENLNFIKKRDESRAQRLATSGIGGGVEVRHDPAGIREKSIKLELCARFLHWALILLALQCHSFAGDLSRGVSFQDGQRVGASDLHNLVDLTTINSTFITRQTLDSTPLGSDQWLIYSPTLVGMRKVTIDSVLGLPDIITSQSAGTVIAPADLLLNYSINDAKLEQVTFQNGFLNNTNWIGGRTQLFIPSTNHFLMVWDGSSYFKIGWTNLFTNFLAFASFTNLAASTRPTNQDELLIFDSLSGSNRQTTIAGLLTNPPAAVNLTNGDTMLMMSQATNGPAGITGTPVLASATLASLSLYYSNAFGPHKFVSSAVQVTNGGMTFITNHGLPGTPQDVRFVFVCTGAEQGYNVGDEVLAATANQNGGVNSMWGGSSTNLFYANQSGFSYEFFNKTNPGNGFNPAVASGLLTNWKLKVYARYWVP